MPFYGTEIYQTMHGCALFLQLLLIGDNPLTEALMLY